MRTCFFFSFCFIFIIIIFLFCHCWPQCWGNNKTNCVRQPYLQWGWSCLKIIWIKQFEKLLNWEISLRDYWFNESTQVMKGQLTWIALRKPVQVGSIKFESRASEEISLIFALSFLEIYEIVAWSSSFWPCRGTLNSSSLCLHSILVPKMLC